MNDVSTRWSTVTVDRGARELRCISCGAHILIADEGTPEAFCKHVVFVENWVGDLEHVRADVADALDAAYDSDDHRAAILDALPDSCFVLEVVEPGRGGGHDGSTFTCGIEIEGG